MAPIGFIDDDNEHLGVLGFRVSTPPLLRGRRNVAIPTGLILPEAKGGVTPYTYTCTDLPGGVTFTAGTRVLSGTPNAAGDFTPTYSVEDADGATVSKEFDWSVLDLISTDRTMIQDFDGGKVGYGISDFKIAYAITMISGATPAFAQVTVWAAPPRTAVGSIVDDPLAVRPLPTGGVMSSIQWRPQFNPDRFRIFDSDEDLDGNAVDSDIGAWGTANPDLNLYLQRGTGNPGVTLEFDDDRQSGANWNITFNVTSAQATWIRANLAEDDQFIFVIAEP